jgi:hypothetical protein
MDRQTYRHRDDRGSGQIKRQTANQFSRLADLQAEIDMDTAADRHTVKETDSETGIGRDRLACSDRDSGRQTVKRERDALRQAEA